MFTLTVFERLILLNVLPVEGDFTTLKIVRHLREDLSFSEEEHKLLDFKNAGETFVEENGTETIVGEGQVKWKETVPVKGIQIGEKATDIIVCVLKKLNDDKKLRNEHMSLYEKFVEA
ncbi:MAG TPA: hypothetical protein ENH82_12385 [bacterium]|nr:hypothetical protein [bacterium]